MEIPMRACSILALAFAACGSKSGDGWSADIHPNLLGHWGQARIPSDPQQPQLAVWSGLSISAGQGAGQPATWSGQLRTTTGSACVGLWSGTVRARENAVRFEAESPEPMTIDVVMDSSANGIDFYSGTMTWLSSSACLPTTTTIRMAKAAAPSSRILILIEWDAPR